MIVTLAELKSALGIDPGNTDEDAHLTRLILGATIWVQNETHRYFDTPITRTEYRNSPRERILYLNGHIDDSVYADNALADLDPSTSVHVFRRTLWASTDWEELVEGTDWERRIDALLYRAFWFEWPCEDEYKIVYLDGWAEGHAPDDIKQVIIEVAVDRYNLDAINAAGTAGITSESLGDYSYTRDLGAVATGQGRLTQIGMQTINHYKRLFV